MNRRRPQSSEANEQVKEGANGAHELNCAQRIEKQEKQVNEVSVWKMWPQVVRAVLLNKASTVFWIGAFIAYWCTPRYEFNLPIGFYFFCVFFWPATCYVGEIGSSFAHVDLRGGHVPMSLREILQRIAISISFMMSVVLIASVARGHVELPFSTTKYVFSVASAVTRIAGFFGVDVQKQLQQSQQQQQSHQQQQKSDSVWPMIFVVLQMTVFWAISFFVHFIGLGLIPKYFRQWWDQIILSARKLYNDERDKQLAAAELSSIGDSVCANQDNEQDNE